MSERKYEIFAWEVEQRTKMLRVLVYLYEADGSLAGTRRLCCPLDGAPITDDMGRPVDGPLSKDVIDDVNALQAKLAKYVKPPAK